MCSEGCTAGHCSGAPFLCLECWPSPLTCLSISAEGRKPLGEGMSHWNQFVPGLKQFDGSYIAACSVMDDFFANLEKRVAHSSSCRQLICSGILPTHSTHTPCYRRLLNKAAGLRAAGKTCSQLQHDSARWTCSYSSQSRSRQTQAEASDSAFASVLNGSVTDEVGDEIRDEVAKDQLKNVQLTCAVVAFHSF